MPTTIPMSSIWEAGEKLGRFGGTPLPGGILVEMYGKKMVIKQGAREVFSMKTVQVLDQSLLIDFPKTAEGQDGRGWGILGMLIALHHGKQRECKKVELLTQIEMTASSLGFWGKFGIGSMQGTPLSSALDRGIAWVMKYCDQGGGEEPVFVLRDARKQAA